MPPAAGRRSRRALDRLPRRAWRDPAVTMMGSEQEDWLAGRSMRFGARAGRWQVLAQQIVMGRLACRQGEAWIAPDVSRATRQDFLVPRRAGGGPAVQPRQLGRLSRGACRVACARHWTPTPTSSSLPATATMPGRSISTSTAPAGVEFAGHSVTSPGYETTAARSRQADVARATRARNPPLKWADLSRRGYVDARP